jgi:large subunit ribosomal protein L10
LPTQAKVDRVAELREKLENCSIVISTGYSGIGVNQMVNLRRRMSEGGVEFIVVKNNLLSLAADGASVPQLKEVLSGQTAIALGYDDAVATAKTVAAAATADGTLAIHGAVVSGGPAMAPTEVSRLASLPPQPVLIAQLLGNMQGPLYGLATVLNGTIAGLAYALQARIDQLQPESESEPEEAQSEPAEMQSEPAEMQSEPEEMQPEPEEAQPEPVAADQ